MGRKKLKVEDKKQTISVRVPNELLPNLSEIENKSKFFEWLLVEHFNNLKNEK
jgi:hypothetical protein